MSRPENKLHPLDVLNSRLDQALSILVCVANTYDGDNGFMIPDTHLANVIWAVNDQLQECRDAFNELLDERNAAKELPMRGAA